MCRVSVAVFFPTDVLLIYLCTVMRLIRAASVAVSRCSHVLFFCFFYLAGPKLKRPPWSWTPSYVKFPFNVLLCFFFQMPPLGHLRSNPNAPALFFASATPSRPVKIDSLASSTRQLWAICSRLGSSSSFCFCDCSYNVICSELELEKKVHLEGEDLIWLPWQSFCCLWRYEKVSSAVKILKDWNHLSVLQGIFLELMLGLLA